jgi:ubiquinone/menaquinone biosynthesis C-methylase UbiE
MLVGARDRLKNPLFCPVAADGQALPFRSGSFDAVICQLGLQFFPNPARGLAEFHRVLRRRASITTNYFVTHKKSALIALSVLIAQAGQRGDPGLASAGNLANVG